MPAPIGLVAYVGNGGANTGGQACTSGFTGQVADMSAYGKAQHGKQEVRKELALIAMAHRGAFVLQSSQASPAHLIAGVIKGLNSRRPAIFNIYAPCPVEHGLPDEWAPTGARMALEARAFPFLVFDPDAGKGFADCLTLDGNPALDDLWPTYELKYVDDQGAQQVLELPFTTADWAATEVRFKKHFKVVKPEAWNEDMVPFHEFIALPADEREGKTPFIHVLTRDGKLGRMSVSPEIVTLTEDRLLFWAQLRELAGLEVPESVRDLVAGELEAEFDRKLDALRAEYEAKLAQLKASYPQVIARKLAEALVRRGNGSRTVADILKEAESLPGLEPVALDALAVAPTAPAPAAAGGVATAAAPAPAAVAAAPAPAAEPEADDGLAMEPYIESARCTSCNECINLNKKMFGYNENKQAVIKDPKAGTFAQLVQAAERCPAGIIHPGTPLNPKEKDLDKWIKRAEPFN